MKRRPLPPRRVLVTGGATNIGRAITECFLRDGARVAVGQLLRPTTDDLVKEHGKKVVPIQFDQGRAEDCQRAVAEAVDALDELDVLAVLYRMLERHGWRKVAPDTRHPKADPKAQEDLKQNSRKRWQICSTTNPSVPAGCV